MVAPSARTVVLVSFPFSDLSQTKLRPAVVLADAGRDDWILCQITSKAYGDTHALALSVDDFVTGSLRAPSHVRPSKLFTANDTLIVAQIGELKADSFRHIIETTISILRSGLADKQTQPDRPNTSS